MRYDWPNSVAYFSRSGNPHVRFDERGMRMEMRRGLLKIRADCTLNGDSRSRNAAEYFESRSPLVPSEGDRHVVGSSRQGCESYVVSVVRHVRREGPLIRQEE